MLPSRRNITKPAATRSSNSPASFRNGASPPRRQPAAIFAETVQRPQLSSAQPQLTLQGYIDAANSSRITGWVWDPVRPHARIALELLNGDQRLAKLTANQYRADLQRAGIGDGRYGFALPLGEVVLPGERNILRLRCVETGAEMPGSPMMIEHDAAKRAAEQGLSEPAAHYKPAFRSHRPANGAGDEIALPSDVDDSVLPDGSGKVNGAAPTALPLGWGTAARLDADVGLESNIDWADWTGVRGWVWDRHDPQRRIVLELLDGEIPLTTVSACDYRGDLEEAGIGDGRHGFSIRFAETLLPNARHVLHLRPVGSKVELSSFPLALTRTQAGFDQVVRFVLGNLQAEAERAEKSEDLTPLINALVGFLDVALARYFQLDHQASANAAAFLGSPDVAPQASVLIDSIKQNYTPIITDFAEQPAVSIVIPVFNKFELTYACIKSIVEQGAQVPFEIIIVDDCSRDATMLAGFAFGPAIRVIRNAENCGFIRSCNLGSDAARGEYVVFLNNDTQVKPRWLDELYETMQRGPDIGVVGGKLLYPDGSLQECGGVVWRLGDAWNWGRGEAADDPRFCYMREVDYVSGAALMVRTKLFHQLGKFDECYAPMYYEDTDLCFRVRQQGYRVAVQPAAEIVHFEGASAGTNLTGGMKRFQAINHRKFFERWKDTLATHRFNGELPELEAERNVRQRALFIDDSVPEPDKDAGSNAAYQHMLSLQRLGYKVTFIPGDNMAKIDPYTADLQRRGIECLYHPYYSSVEDAFRKKPVPFDLVYLHRFSNASKYAGMIRQHFPDARILYSVADLHFLRMQRQAELEDDAKLRDKAEQLRRLELSAMSFVDCVIVHSASEAELLRQLAPEIAVQVIPWTIPLREVKAVAPPRPAIAFIGGYRHPPNVDAAVWAAQSIMPLLRKRAPGVELLLVGSHMPSEVSRLAAKDIIPLGYVPSLDGVFGRVKLTIAPLRYGAGLKGKVLESMAAGIPCVMTTVAAEGINLPPQLKSLVADNPKMLADRVAALCRDGAEYRRIVKASKAHIAANYSPERIDALIRQACETE